MTRDVSSTVPVTDEAERLHPVEDPSPHWSDSLYFNAWDPTTSTFLITRIAVQANAGRVTAGMLAWVDGVPAYGFGREPDEIPATDWDVMSIDGLTYRMVASGQRWAVQLDDGDSRAHLEFDGSGPTVSYGDHPDGPLPRAVAWGHYEQTCRVTGDLVLHGKRIAFDGFGQRDHSWGFRHWAGLHQWHWVTGYFDDGTGFNLFEVHSHDGTTTVNGYVQTPDGSTSYVRRAARDLVRAGDGGAEAYQLELTTDAADPVVISAHRAATPVPVRPAPDQPVTVHETPMRLTRAGSDAMGFGIYEHLVTEFD